MMFNVLKSKILFCLRIKKNKQKDKITMKTKLNNNTWIFVAIQDPGKNEHFLGLHHDQMDVAYIPAFLNKDDAQSCLINLPTKRGKKYEVQAVMYEDLAKDASKDGFLIFILDGDGNIIDKLLPDQS